MAIPDYQSLMLPVLKLLGDGQPRRVVAEITDPIAEQFALTPEDRQQMLPSGAMPTLDNRVHWAVTYMSKAGLLFRPQRGRAAITDLGRRPEDEPAQDRRSVPDPVPDLRRVPAQGGAAPSGRRLGAADANRGAAEP
jgi:restriction endonuclease Mrr